MVRVIRAQTEGNQRPSDSWCQSFCGTRLTPTKMLFTNTSNRVLWCRIHKHYYLTQWQHTVQLDETFTWWIIECDGESRCRPMPTNYDHLGRVENFEVGNKQGEHGGLSVACTCFLILKEQISLSAYRSQTYLRVNWGTTRQLPLCCCFIMCNWYFPSRTSWRISRWPTTRREVTQLQLLRLTPFV